ncbi:MAG: ChbG/HpnK family deacetylase [Elusimicrobia bacterium]|nr:ChbG/HpnK family deacetylase [Elusimicrobiota bacterium]
MKRLIVTADDFGISPAVNEAVVRAYRDGILRYASLMVDAPAAAQAVSLAKENPGLGVGLHLDLCSGDPAAWGLRYFFFPADRARVEPEIRRQIEKMLSFGLKATHADGHCNIHVHPTVFPTLASLAREYGIPRLRLPGGEAWLCASFERRRVAARLAVAAVFRCLGDGLRPYGTGLAIPERTLGLLRSGLMSEEYFLWLIRHLPEGVSEAYCHPSSDPGSRVVDAPRPGHHTVTELEALLSPRVREALAEEGIGLEAEARPAAR